MKKHLLISSLVVIFVICPITLGLITKANFEREADKEAIKQAALDYAEGFYEGNAERMQKAVHPDIAKRGLMQLNKTGQKVLNPMNAEMLVEITRMGVGKIPADQRKITVEVLDIYEDIASAKVFTAKFNDYLHLAKQNGQWRIVNVLWTPPVPPAK